MINKRRNYGMVTFILTYFLTFFVFTIINIHNICNFAHSLKKENKQTTTSDLSESEVKFLKWLDSKDIPKHDLEIKYFPTIGTKVLHRGLTSKVDKKRGDLLLQIPSSLFMSKLSASRSKIGKVLDMLSDVVGEKVVLALHTLYEKYQPNSEWREYLDIMPKMNELDHMLFWSEQDIALLQCPEEWQCPIIARVRKQRKKVGKLYTELQPVMHEFFEANQFTYENFAWAYAISLSRSFALNITERYGHSIVTTEKEKAKDFGILSLMVPFCDFLNHHNSYPALQFAYDYDDKTKFLKIYADNDYIAGEEIFISYGIMTNPDLLVTYGFVLPNNAYETVGFGLGLDQATEQEDALLNDKMALLKRQQLEADMQTHVALDGQPSPRFIEGMRIRELTRKDVLPDSGSCGTPDNVPPSQFPPPPPGMQFPPGVTPPPGMQMPPPLPPNVAGSAHTAAAGNGAPNSPPPPAGDMNAIIADAIKQALGKAIPGMDALTGQGNSDDSAGEPKNDMNKLLQDILKKSALGKLAGAGEENQQPTLSPEELKAKLESDKKRKEEAGKITKAFKEINPAEPINGENEFNLFSSLLHGAESLLRKYPTSLEEDLYYFSEAYENSPNPIKLTSKQKQALMMRIEIKRILHATILESMQGMKNAYAMQATERDYDLPKEGEVELNKLKQPVAKHDNEMEVKRIKIQSGMLNHFDEGTSKWHDQWETWREDIRLTWGKENALPKGADFATRLGSSEEIIKRATERFDPSDDNSEGIRIGDFLRFTDVVSKEMERQMTKDENSESSSNAAFTGA